MRVSIERGYQPAIKELMRQLRTDDPKLAVHHVIGCWFASNGCPGHAVASIPTATEPLPSQLPTDEFSDITEWA